MTIFAYNTCYESLTTLIKKKIKIMDNFKQKQLFELQINVNLF